MTIRPYRRPLRLPRVVGNVRTPTGADDAAMVLIERLIEKGPHMVMVSRAGDVYPVQYLDYRAELLSEAHPAWVAGTFTRSVDLAEMADALTHTWAEQVIAG